MTRLKNVLLINAVSSGATGLLLIVFSEFITDLFGVTQSAPFSGIGIFLVLFAAYVFIQSRKEPVQPKKVQAIVVTDILWVIASLVIILPQLFGLTSLGYILIGAVAIWVAAMAFLQAKGLKTLVHG